MSLRYVKTNITAGLLVTLVGVAISLSAFSSVPPGQQSPDSMPFLLGMGHAGPEPCRPILHHREEKKLRRSVTDALTKRHDQAIKETQLISVGSWQKYREEKRRDQRYPLFSLSIFSDLKSEREKNPIVLPHLSLTMGALPLPGTGKASRFASFGNGAIRSRADQERPLATIGIIGDFGNPSSTNHPRFYFSYGTDLFDTRRQYEITGGIQFSW